MYVLDTDHISLIQRGSLEGQQILEKLAHFTEDEICTTVITYEEQIKGWLKALSAAKRREDIAFGYLGLKQTVQDFCSIEILLFNLAAIEQYETLRSSYRRLGQNDLKIAAIAIVQNAVLLTRNQKDFGQITELRSEDWSFGTKYTIAHQLYTQLGAAKDIEKLEAWRTEDGEGVIYCLLKYFC